MSSKPNITSLASKSVVEELTPKTVYKSQNRKYNDFYGAAMDVTIGKSLQKLNPVLQQNQKSEQKPTQ